MSSQTHYQGAMPTVPPTPSVRLRVQTKLIIGNAIIIVLLAIIGLLGWQILKRTKESLNHIAAEHLQGAIHLANAQNALWQLRYGVSQYLSANQADRAKIVAQTDQWYKQIDDSLAAYVSTDLTDEEQIGYHVWQEYYQKYATARPRWFELQAQGKVEEAAAWRAKTIFPDGQKAVNALDLLISLQRRAADAEIDETKKTLQGTFIALLVIIVVALLWSSFQAVYFMRAIGRPVRALTDGARALSAGQLDTAVKVPPGDEFGLLGDTFNHMASVVSQQTQRLANQVREAERARALAEQAQAASASQLATIEQQQHIIREMSVPILPLSNSVIILPLIGALDQDRIQSVQQMVLDTIARADTRHVIIDITGVPVIDTQVGIAFIQIIRNVRLLGADVVITGLRPEVAQTMVALNIDLRGIQTYSTLQSGLQAVM